MKKYQCNACEINICTAEYQGGQNVPFKCTGIFDVYHKPHWKEIEPKVANLQPKVATLPDWCKVGEWAYSTVYKEYVKITGIDEFEVEFDSGAYYAVLHKVFREDYKPARLRPYNAEEMKALVGKVLTSNSRSTPFSFLVVYAEGDGSFIESYRFNYTAEELKGYFTIDGKPCGVLEHLEDGEWVK